MFKWRQTAPELILCAVRWYLRYSLSLRDVEELLAERGLEADHTTIWRWVQRYGPELEQRLRPQLKPTNKSWRVDETYIRVQGRWCYLYRAIDSTGPPSTSCCRRCAMPRRPNACSARLSAIHRILSPASSTLIRPAALGFYLGEAYHGSGGYLLVETKVPHAMQSIRLAGATGREFVVLPETRD